ncbi:MAG: TMEM165/GDT1 family protein [Nocardioidaceae bacterium]
MDLSVVLVTFLAIFVVELPDKTFIATLVLSTRYRPLLVWIGVGLAFAVQTIVGVLAGHVATLLPEELIKGVAAAIFLLGAFLLAKSAPGADEEESEVEKEYEGRAVAGKTGLAVVGASFLVLFLAEWGDLSQLLTISLVARYHAPVEVFIGAWLALLTVSGLAVLAGRVLLRYLKLSTVHYAGALVCLVLAVVTIVELVA